MHQPKIIGNAEHGFRVPQKHAAAGKKVFVKPPQDAPLRCGVEVDQHVAAEDEINVLDGRGNVVEQVQAAEGDAGPDRLTDTQFLAHGLKVFLAVVTVDVAQAVLAVLTLPRGFECVLIDVGANDFEGPAFEQPRLLLQQQHGQGVRLLAGRTSRAPHAQMVHGRAASRLNDLGQYDVAESVELGLIAKETGLPHGNFIEQLDEFRAPGGGGNQRVQVIARRLQPEVANAEERRVGLRLQATL